MAPRGSFHHFSASKLKSIVFGFRESTLSESLGVPFSVYPLSRNETLYPWVRQRLYSVITSVEGVVSFLFLGYGAPY